MSLTVISKHNITDKSGKTYKATAVVNESALAVLISALIDIGSRGTKFDFEDLTVFGIVIQETNATCDTTTPKNPPNSETSSSSGKTAEPQP